jgi:hypothetical protein
LSHTYQERQRERGWWREGGRARGRENGRETGREGEREGERREAGGGRLEADRDGPAAVRGETHISNAIRMAVKDTDKAAGGEVEDAELEVVGSGSKQRVITVQRDLIHGRAYGQRV